MSSINNIETACCIVPRVICVNQFAICSTLDSSGSSTWSSSLSVAKLLTDTVMQPKMKPKSIQKLFGDHESKHRWCYPLAVPVTKHWRNCTFFPGEVEVVESFLLDKTIHSVSLWAGFVAVRTAAQTETNIPSQRVATVWIIWNIVSNRFNQPVCGQIMY